jgi:hypothetical protein
MKLTYRNVIIGVVVYNIVDLIGVALVIWLGYEYIL